MSLLIRWAVLAASFAIVAEVWDRLTVTGGVWGHVWVAALFGIVNTLVRPVVSLFALPLTIVTLGLFSLVVNGAMLALTDALSDNLHVDGFWAAVVAALAISVISAVLNRLLTD